MRVEGDYAIFSSGRRVYANNGIIGLDSKLWAHEGYDGGFACWSYWPEDTNALTKEERQELADYMIGLWTKFREADGPVEDD